MNEWMLWHIGVVLKLRQIVIIIIIINNKL